MSAGNAAGVAPSAVDPVSACGAGGAATAAGACVTTTLGATRLRTGARGGAAAREKRLGAGFALDLRALTGAALRTRVARRPASSFVPERGLRDGRALFGAPAFGAADPEARRGVFLFALDLVADFAAALFPGAAVGFAVTDFFWARRARFHTLRAEVDCLRARLASRLASFSRLRARFSSSLAMRTRCFATSAWSRARSRGSVGVVGSLPFFFIRLPAKSETGVSLTQASEGFHPRDLSTEFVHKYVDRTAAQRQTRNATNGLRQSECDFASCAQNRPRVSAFAPFANRDIL